MLTWHHYPTQASYRNKITLHCELFYFPPKLFLRTYPYSSWCWAHRARLNQRSSECQTLSQLSFSSQTQAISHAQIQDEDRTIVITHIRSATSPISLCPHAHDVSIAPYSRSLPNKMFELRRFLATRSSSFGSFFFFFKDFTTTHRFHPDLLTTSPWNLQSI